MNSSRPTITAAQRRRILIVCLMLFSLSLPVWLGSEPATASLSDRPPATLAPAGLAQQAYLKASNPDAGDLAGAAVAIDGDTLVVGAPAEASGVPGDQTDNSAPAAGAAYVFVRTNGVWSQQAYLKASNPGAGDRFGSVAISGDTLVVGAQSEDSNGSNPADNSAQDSGAAYIFVRTNGIWSQQAYLKASNAEAGDFFGGSVSIAGDTLVVGAQGEDSNGSGPANNSATSAGAAYVFTRTDTAWTQQAYLKASNAGSSDGFGRVALSGDTLVVGAFQESSAATGVNGNQADNSAFSAGAAYVFTRTGTAWAQQAYLKASNAEEDDFFGIGIGIGISGDTIAISAFGEDSAATGVNGDESDNSTNATGAAYLFVRTGTTWTQQAYLKASNTRTGNSLGFNIAVRDSLVVVGDHVEDSAATGVDGDETNTDALNSGAAYVFARTDVQGVPTWSQQAYLKASNTNAYDGFGMNVAIGNNNTIVVAAFQEDSAAAGVNGDQADNSALNAGAAYVFTDVVPPSRISLPLLVH